MTKNKIAILIVIFISIIIVSLYGTFAILTDQMNESEKFDYAFTIGKHTNQKIIIPSKKTKTFDVTLTNPYDGALKYGLTYDIKNNYDVNIGILNTSENSAQDIINSKETKVISIIINNPTENDVTINLALITGYINGGELIIEKGQQIITQEIDINNIIDTNLDESGANKPNITEGMIPIYYNEEDRMWHKADQSNTNAKYQWYDYNNKKWANVVLVTPSTLNKYKKLKVGDIIEQEDILAYLVWIPKFKYQVWDIEQTNDKNKYYYNGLEDGINIIFELANNNTGEIICNKDNICTGENGQYYTHPAFHFDDKDLTGFWIGKFETTGTKNEPTILPNYSSLTLQNITEQYQISKLLTNTELYNLKNSNLDSHVIKDLEWSAVSYLTNSIYGMCTGAKNGCRELYTNNSLYYNTGTSSGNKNEPTNSGTYSYLGEMLDEYGIATETIDTTIISSTTGNVYGVYDMAGGAYESIMLTTNAKNEYLKDIDSKYYNIATEKPLLGELHYEFTIDSLTNEETWVVRGGTSIEKKPQINNFKTYNGDSADNISFRIILT